jgi:hypothetical protein
MPLPLPHIFQIVRALASSIGQAEAGDVDGEAEAALLQIMKLAPVDGKCDALPEADVLRILGLFEAERPSVRKVPHLASPSSRPHPELLSPPSSSVAAPMQAVAPSAAAPSAAAPRQAAAASVGNTEGGRGGGMRGTKRKVGKHVSGGEG